MQVSLKAARINSNMTQRDVADAIGVNVNTVNNWENGKSVPNVSQAMKCCKLYNCNLDDIFLIRD